MTECIKGKVKGLQACSYICACEHKCEVKVEDKFFNLLKESLRENKDLMQMLSKT